MKKHIPTTLLAALTLALTNCASIQSFLRSDEGQVVVQAGGAILIESAIDQEPQLEPVFTGLADAIELKRVDLSEFESPEHFDDWWFDPIDDGVMSTAIQGVGAVIAFYANRGSVTADVVAKTIRLGVSDYRKGSK